MKGYRGLIAISRGARLRRPAVPAFVVGLVLASLVASTTALADPGKVGYPNSMASTGDSITRAFNTGSLPFGDAPANSWSTGTSTTVNSHYRRILAANALINGKNFNDAKSGTKMIDLNGQVTTVNSRGVEYVTILMGGNDVCTPSEAAMTPVATFRSQFETAIKTLSSGSPDARIYVVSIPDVHRLWSILKDNATARSTWNLFKICQSLLANPLSTLPADVSRRDRVRQRNIAFNTQLAAVCAQYIHCRFDANAVFNEPFVPSDVSTRDFFHPSVAGQTRLAKVSWLATFNFADGVAPTSTASADAGVVTISATDNVGVAGIEYKLGTGAYQRYSGPVTVPAGTTITFRAVDVNGNIETSQSLVG